MCPRVSTWSSRTPSSDNECMQSFYTRLNAFDSQKRIATEVWKVRVRASPVWGGGFGFQSRPQIEKRATAVLGQQQRPDLPFDSVHRISGNQASSNLSVWKQMPLKDEIQEAFPINYTLYYEPVYIVQHGSMPFHERFIAICWLDEKLTSGVLYLDKKIDAPAIIICLFQGLEMYLTNFTSHLLDKIFICHIYLKVRDPNYMSIRTFHKYTKLISTRKL